MGGRSPINQHCHTQEDTINDYANDYTIMPVAASQFQSQMVNKRSKPDYDGHPTIENPEPVPVKLITGPVRAAKGTPVPQSTTPNPRTKADLSLFNQHSSGGRFESLGASNKGTTGPFVDNYRGSLNPKRWRPSYDTAEIGELIKMSREPPRNDRYSRGGRQNASGTVTLSQRVSVAHDKKSSPYSPNGLNDMYNSTNRRFFFDKFDKK